MSSKSISLLLDKLFNSNPNEQIIKTVKGEVSTPQSKLNSLNKGEDNTMRKEQKYFIGYAGYHEMGHNLFGGIVHIDEEITSELLDKMNENLMERLNEGSKSNPYIAVQVFNIVKLD